MKQWIKAFLAGGGLAVALLGTAMARPLEDGVAAYRKGDYAAASQIFRPLADQGNAAAQFNLGVMYKRGQGIPQDYAHAMIWFRKAADQGYAAAQFNLGLLYVKGDGVPQDYAQAMIWFRKAADQGQVDAQASLGRMYDRGWGVPQDYAQAVGWYRKAADQGDAVAQSNLGAMYQDGQGVPQDYAQAVAWYRKAADQGDAVGQANLGGMYVNGQGVPRDYAQAVYWFRKAADQGDANGQYNLGVCYANGWSVPRDYAQAVSLYRKASDQGLVFAQRYLAWTCSNVPEAKTACLPSSTNKGATEIRLKKSGGGRFLIPVSINGADELNFLIDSGADDVVIPFDVFVTLKSDGTIRSDDLLGSRTGSLLKVGDQEIENVAASVSTTVGKVSGPLLLGQSFLTRFKSWSIDNERGVLLLN